ncbi:ion transport protein [Nitzschia inconspicua]|uniref:Ion transport protein n=1 Tax=Nitzschia inconspicua TaxID=303405 RepID=A0A9K3L638_9STRA|nr:ion transport protein [Nitzschia inconspicua]
MVSPRKKNANEAVSPRLARFIAGSVRRRQSFGSKKSSNTGSASGSTQKHLRKWPLQRQGIVLSKSKSQEIESRDDAKSPESFSPSPSNVLRRRSVDSMEVSPLGSPKILQFDDTIDQNAFQVPNTDMNDHVARKSMLTNKLGSILPGTPSQGYHSLTTKLPDPSPRARSSLSRICNPHATRKISEVDKLNRSPSSLGLACTSASGQSKSNVPDIDRHKGLSESQRFGIPRTKNFEESISKLDKTTEKRSNRQLATHFDFLNLKKSRNVIIPKTQRNFDRSIPSEAEEVSSPLFCQSISDHIASDRSETIVFYNESGESPDSERNGREREYSECLEVVRVDNQENPQVISSIRSTSERDGFMQIMRRDRSASELHSLCACMTTLEDVLRARSFFVGMSHKTASRQDYKGETPMHAFSNNKTLAVNLTGNNEFETKDYLVLYRQPTFDQESLNQLHEQTTKFLKERLLPSFPGAMIIRDNKGYVPFEEGLLDWIDTNKKANDVDAANNDNYSNYLSSYTNAVSDAVSHAWKSTSTTLLTAMSKMAEPDMQKGDERDVETGESGDIKQVSSKDELTGHRGDTSAFLNQKKLSPHARFCLQMLSLIVEQLEMSVDKPTVSIHSGIDVDRDQKPRKSTGLQLMYRPLDLAAQIVENVAAIPALLQTILSINEDADMEFALSTTIIRRVLIDKHSVGPWLTNMLQNPHRSVSRRAIEYLQIVSKLCEEEEKATTRHAGESKPASDELIEEVSRLRDFVPSLLSLGENGMEEASTTKVVSDVLDKMISKPFVATVVLFDAVFLALMILGFRSAVNGMIMGASLDTVLSWIYVANIGIFYFLIQEIGKIVSLLLISSHSRKYFLSFWNLIDVLAIVLALCSSVAMRWQFAIHMEGLEDADPLRGLLAISTGFLWLRVLSFLKSINIQLATFILAIITITKDILFFCVILLTLVISFSQMFFTLLAPSSCATGSISSQCSYGEYLLQFYIMMLGDFGNSERETFTTPFSVLMLVFYSFLVTVILLNVLIAIAGDSYEKCLLNSQRLFGRARVMLVAELVSFQSLLRKRDYQGEQFDHAKKNEDGVFSNWWMSGSWSWTRKWSRGSIVFFGLSMFVTFVWTIAEIVGFSRGGKYVSIVSSLSSVFVTIALYVTVILFLGQNPILTKKDGVPKKEWSNILQRVVLRVLGASQERRKEARRSKNKGQGDWHGRVQFLRREMDRIAEKQSELLNEQSEDFQAMVGQSENRLRSELQAIEERFRETNHSIVSAVDELKALISMAGSTAPEFRSPVPKEVEIEI